MPPAYAGSPPPPCRAFGLLGIVDLLLGGLVQHAPELVAILLAGIGEMQGNLLVGHFERLADGGVDVLGGDQAGVAAFAARFRQRELMQIGPELVLLSGVEVVERVRPGRD